MTSDEVTIYIQLLDEGTITYRPTQAMEVRPGIYRVLPTDNYDPEDEIWEFLPGSLVAGEERMLSGVDQPNTTGRTDEPEVKFHIVMKKCLVATRLIG